MGLAGEYNEHEARANVVALGEKSAQIIQEQNDASLKGYYFPVEADPTWLRVSTLGHVLEKYPLLFGLVFIVVKVNLKTTIYGLKAGFLNKQAFFQDGVGVGVRTPEQARRILDQLEQTLGKDKTVIVLEAFRTKKNGQFRAAYPWEIISQIKAYEGKKIYIFDGPTIWADGPFILSVYGIDSFMAAHPPP